MFYTQTTTKGHTRMQKWGQQSSHRPDMTLRLTGRYKTIIYLLFFCIMNYMVWEFMTLSLKRYYKSCIWKNKNLHLSAYYYYYIAQETKQTGTKQTTKMASSLRWQMKTPMSSFSPSTAFITLPSAQKPSSVQPGHMIETHTLQMKMPLHVEKSFLHDTSNL